MSPAVARLHDSDRSVRADWAPAQESEWEDRSENPFRRIPGVVRGGELMNAPLPQHAALGSFPVEEDCIVIGGMPVTELARRVSSTPFYAYDRRLLDERVALVRRHLPAEVQLHYAIKANPMPALVRHM